MDFQKEIQKEIKDAVEVELSEMEYEVACPKCCSIFSAKKGLIVVLIAKKT